MAVIQTDEDFVNAISHLIANNLLPVQGARFVDRMSRTVWDERVDGIVDITPDTPTLETALDSALVTMATEQIAVTVQANAKAQAAAIPSWATFSENEALEWHDTNITNALPAANLAAANVVLSRLATENRALVRMVIALRNQLYPDLQG